MMGICQHSLYVGLAACLLADGVPATAGMVVSSVGLPARIDFEDFRGAGFSPAPSAGQLDSRIWRVTGLSDGPGQFGGTHVTGDFARGSSSGGVSVGGVYAFNVGSVAAANWVLGFQPIGNDLTPGEVTLWVTNGTGASIDWMELGYEVWIRNDGGRSSSFNFAYSFDDVDYVPLGELDLTSPLAADPEPQWVSVNRMATLTGLNLASGASLFLQWQLDDVAGTGNRDEWGLDQIEIVLGRSMHPVPEPSAWLVFSVFGPALLCVRRRGDALSGRPGWRRGWVVRRKRLASIEGIPSAQI